MNLKRIKCMIVGHDWKIDSARSEKMIITARRCSYCGHCEHERVVFPRPSRPAPPMPECKPNPQICPPITVAVTEGDLVVLSYPGFLTRDQHQSLTASMNARLPHGATALILVGGMEFRGVLHAANGAAKEDGSRTR